MMYRSAMKRKEREESEEDRSIREIYLEGYDGNIEKPLLEKMMRNYFESCGEITNVVFTNGVGGRLCTISIRGKKAEEAALRRTGNDAGGWRVLVSRPIPTKEDLERRGWTPEMDKHRTMFVEGYDTSLPRDVIEGKLKEYFSPCGKVEKVRVPPGDGDGRCYSKATLRIYGEGVVEKVQSHCESGKGDFEWDMRVVLVSPPASLKSSRGMSAGFTRKHLRLR